MPKSYRAEEMAFTIFQPKSVETFTLGHSAPKIKTTSEKYEKLLTNAFSSDAVCVVSSPPH